MYINNCATVRALKAHVRRLENVLGLDAPVCFDVLTRETVQESTEMVYDDTLSDDQADRVVIEMSDYLGRLGKDPDQISRVIEHLFPSFGLEED